MRPKIKICGMIEKDNSLAVADCGVDALGFVFYAGSKRYVDYQKLDWLQQLPTFVTIFGLFVNPTREFVSQVCAQLPIDILQFHGFEDAEFCAQFNKRYVKAVPMQQLSPIQIAPYLASYPQATGFLLDNYGKQSIGGTGEAFDWKDISQLSTEFTNKIILAGGINQSNIAQAVLACHPYGIDISSGVEETAGIKSLDKVKEIIALLDEMDEFC